MMPSTPILLSFLLFILAVFRVADAHGLMAQPRVRGAQFGSRWLKGGYTPGYKPDFHVHFPAGDKRPIPGIGKKSQIAAARGVWTPFAPHKSGFVWRAGVCGDLKGVNDHLKGGEYYHGGISMGNYTEGAVIEVKTVIIAHHNGYFELRLCDISKCGDKMNEACFRNNHCPLLERVAHPVCESRRSKKCGPIDRANPGRWYLPCSDRRPGADYDEYGGEYAKFKLPAGHTGKFVLHWFWTSANNCNPPGVKEYFRNERYGPKWGTCTGQAGAVGGYTSVQNDCGTGSPVDDRFPEEYYQCADVMIRPRGGGTRAPTTTPPDGERNSRPTPTPSRTPTPRPRRPSTTAPPRRTTRSRGDPFKKFVFVSRGRVIRRWSSSEVKLNIKRLPNLAIRVITRRSIVPVEFFIDGRKVWTERRAPYYLFGDSGGRPNYFGSRINRLTNRRFKLKVKWSRFSMVTNILLEK